MEGGVVLLVCGGQLSFGGAGGGAVVLGGLFPLGGGLSYGGNCPTGAVVQGAVFGGQLSLLPLGAT